VQVEASGFAGPARASAPSVRSTRRDLKATMMTSVR
jgi:hypothetical protein